MGAANKGVKWDPTLRWAHMGPTGMAVKDTPAAIDKALAPPDPLKLPDAPGMAPDFTDKAIGLAKQAEAQSLQFGRNRRSTFLGGIKRSTLLGG